MSLNIVIDADVQTATAKIGKFVYTFKESFKEVEDTVKRTSARVKQETDQIGNSVRSFGKSSQNALTALSLTIQDLPFGFIGIQNNLPGIIQGFSQMSEEAKSGASVLSQLRTTLTGPAGLFLAFSAVTAGITYAIQKYGSLGNAIDVLFGKQSLLVKAQKEFNDAIAESSANNVVEAEKIKILTKVILDSQEPQQKRLESYNEFKRLIPEVNGAIEKENSLSAKGLRIIKALAEARIALLELKIEESGITAVLEENEKELQKTKQDATVAEEKLNKAKKASLESSKKINNAVLASGNYYKIETGQVSQSQLEYDRLTNKIKSLSDVKKSYIDRLNTSVLGIAKLNKIIDDYGDTLDDQSEKEKNEEERLKKLTKAQEAYRKGWEGIINELERVRKQKFESISAANEFNVDERFKKIAEQAKKATIEQEKYRKGMEWIISQLQQRDSLNMADPFAVDSLKNFEQTADKLVNETLSLNVVDAIKNNFTQPLTDLFLEFTETGKIAFESFQETVLKTIKQLVAKILASGLINLISSIFFPGAGIVGIGGILTQTFADVFGGVNQRVAAPSFGGVGGGAMGMTGQVNLVLRGQDLVGSINRTNSTINRVG